LTPEEGNLPTDLSITNGIGPEKKGKEGEVGSKHRATFQEGKKKKKKKTQLHHAQTINSKKQINLHTDTGLTLKLKKGPFFVSFLFVVVPSSPSWIHPSIRPKN
jgi:hypothetical protein